MKTDKQMTQAAILLSKLEFQQGISSEAQSVASFIKRVLIPLMTEAENSNAYKDAKRSLIDRGKSAKTWMEEKGTLDRHLSDFLK